MEEKRKGREFVFLPSNLFGLLSLASRVFDNNGPAGIRVPIPMPGRAPVEIVTTPRAATRGRFRLPSSRAPRLGEIYLPRKSTGGTLNSISSHKEKKNKRERGKKREKTRTETALLSFVSHTRYVSWNTYFGSYDSIPESLFHLLLAYCSLVAYRKRCDLITA